MIKKSLNHIIDEGTISFFNSVRMYISKQILIIKYNIRRILINNTVINQKGIALDVGFDQFSNEMKRQFILRSFNPYISELAEIAKPYLVDCDVIELGAGSGFTASYFSNFVDKNHKFVALEANPVMVEVLLDTTYRNNTIIEVCACAYGSPSGEMSTLNIKSDFWASSTASSIESSKTIKVATMSLRKIILEYDVNEFVLFCNAEGIEYEMFENEMDILVDMCRLMLVSFHDNKVKGKNTIYYVKLLESKGFKLMNKIGTFHVFNNINFKI